MSITTHEVDAPEPSLSTSVNRVSTWEVDPGVGLITGPDVDHTGTPVMWNEDGVDRTGIIESVQGESPDAVATCVPDDGGDPVDVPLAVLGVLTEKPVEVPAVDNPDGYTDRSRFAGDSLPVGLEPVVAVSGDDGTMRWRGPLVVEGIESGDGRMIAQGALSHRELPLPLMAMFRNPDGGMGHAAAEVVGRIDNIFRPDDLPGQVWGEGVYDNSPLGREAFRLLNEKMMRGVSVDLDNLEAEFQGNGDDGALDAVDGKLLVTSARIMGATQCAFPAFAEAYLEVITSEEHDAIVASGGGYVPFARVSCAYDAELALVASGAPTALFPTRPPAGWFAKPTTIPPVAPVRAELDGRVHGFVAMFSGAGSCHTSWGNKCVTVPRTDCFHGEFRKGRVLCDNGEFVATGPIMTDTVHPNLKMHASDAQSFYANTGCVAADVALYDIEGVGIYAAGAMRPHATEEQFRVLNASDVSPDWRRINGHREREILALLAVNSSGYKVPVALVASGGGEIVVPGTGPRAYMLDGEVEALVAAGPVRRFDTDDRVEQLEAAVRQLGQQLGVTQRRLAPLHRAALNAQAAELIAARSS